MPGKTYYAKGYKRRQKSAAKRGSWGKALTRKYSAYDLARKAYGAASYISRYMLNTEKGYLNTTNSVSVSTTPTITWLSNITQGDTTGQRHGRQVKLVGLNARLHFNLNPAQQDDTIRLLIVRIKADFVPTVTDILETQSVHSLRALNRVREIDVIRDDIITLNVGEKSTKLIKYNIKMSNKCQWEVGTNNPEWGHIYALMFAQHASGASPTGCDFQYRIRFIDN